jgi:hypothetical protein
MSRISDAIARASAVAQARRPTRSHPDGWEPGVRWDEATRTGGITISTNKPSPQWDALLAEWGFDPALFEVADDTIQFRTWDANIGEGNVQRFYYYKAQIRAKRPEVDSDLAALVDEVRKRKPRPVAALEGDRSLVIALSDWQIGREGTEEATQRILRLIDEIPALWREYVKQGIPLTDIVLVGLGDLIEGCSGWYPAQAFTIEFNAREQRTLARRLLVKVIEAALTVAPTVRVVVVGGNHGENRNSEGKPYTDSSDNGDVEIAEQAAEVFAANDALRDRVAFVVPRDELAITIDVHGTIVGLTHGHLGRSGGNSTAKVESWWKGQALGMKPIADATLLLTAHYHHLALMTHGPRTHIQAPAMCGRSAWFDDVTGVGDSPAGTLTLVVGGGRWDRLRLIAG